jgi:hypothetical protein
MQDKNYNIFFVLRIKIVIFGKLKVILLMILNIILRNVILKI